MRTWPPFPDSRVFRHPNVSWSSPGRHGAGVAVAELAKSGADSGFSGLLSGRAQLTGHGDSAHSMAANAQGTVVALIPHGEMRTALAAGASLNLTAALGALSKADKKTSIRCGVASFAVEDGVLSARTLLVDTDQALITGSGEVHLDTQKLNSLCAARRSIPGSRCGRR